MMIPAFRLHAFVCCLSILFTFTAFSQKEPRFKHDSAYYKTYPTKLTARVYFSKKYTSLLLEGVDDTRALHFRPNTPVNIGVGATYRVLSLNLGVSLQWLNPNAAERGKTKFLDLQSHIYAPKWVIDLYGQFYKGYYVAPRGYASSVPDQYHIRPDLRINMVGVSAYRLLNGERFSYRAAFLQNEWQIKSAGSFLFGGEFYTGSINADSAFVPKQLEADYSQRGIHRNNFTEFGPGIGYAYTAVIDKHFFITGSLTATADISFVKEFSANGSATRTSVSPNASLRGVLGYNSERWIATLSWVNANTNLRGKSSNDQYLVRTGNFRVTLARRFELSKAMKERLKIVEKLQ